MYDLLVTPYLSWVFWFMILPTIAFWVYKPALLWHYRAVFVYAIVNCLIVGLVWDYFAVATKIWWWPAACCSLPRVLGLPFEEVIFIIVAAVYICTLTLVGRDFYNRTRRRKS